MNSVTGCGCSGCRVRTRGLWDGSGGQGACCVSVGRVKEETTGPPCCHSRRVPTRLKTSSSRRFCLPQKCGLNQSVRNLSIRPGSRPHGACPPKGDEVILVGRPPAFPSRAKPLAWKSLFSWPIMTLPNPPSVKTRHFVHLLGVPSVCCPSHGSLSKANQTFKFFSVGKLAGGLSSTGS